jgi:hypothetical protein
MPFWNNDTKRVNPVAGIDVVEAAIRKGKLFASLYILNQFYDIKDIGNDEPISDKDQVILIELIALANTNDINEFNKEYFKSEVQCELPGFISKLETVQNKIDKSTNSSFYTLLNKLIESLTRINSIGGGRNKTSRKTKRRKYKK